MKRLVLSGINLFEGGPLSIYHDFLNMLIEDKYFEKYDITIFVHKKELFNEYIGKIKIIELPRSRKNYLYRLYYEYFYFWNYSRTKDIDIWISLHDITPNVKAKKRFVYCHNSAPFLKNITWNIFKYSKTTYFMKFFYSFLYKINIKKNTYVIVQQNWIREEFERRFNIKNILISKPYTKGLVCHVNDIEKINKKYIFIYPVFPRVFKNFEVICEACKLLNTTVAKDKYKVIFTIDGSENNYSKMLLEKYKVIKNIEWIGLQSRKKLFELYKNADCMIFSSLLETWGLPISEFKNTNKPILLADLAYSYETIGTYTKVNFFPPTNPKDLSNLMLDMINNKKQYKGNIDNIYKDCYFGWSEICKAIILGDEK